ncbi:hypothetical protein GW17_00021674, partial [Ensete ventricosum]
MTAGPPVQEVHLGAAGRWAEWASSTVAIVPDGRSFRCDVATCTRRGRYTQHPPRKRGWQRRTCPRQCHGTTPRALQVILLVVKSNTPSTTILFTAY